MPTYYMNDGAFQLPDVAFQDLTIHQLTASLPGDREMSLAVGRSKITEGATLRQIVNVQLDHAQKRLPGHTVLAAEETEVAGAPAIDVRCRFRHENEAFYARQVHVAAFDVCLSFVLSGPLTEQATVDRTLEEIAGSLRLRDAS